MKIVFFDMEFANGKIPGSVYSLGYVQTNQAFKLTEPQTDLLMNPDCPWNDYVRSHILAYPMRVVREASLFPAYYKRIKRLLCKADLVVGFSVKNDTTALYRACQRYDLKPLQFSCLDMERLCKALKDHPEAHGLSGFVRAYCGINPDNQHRSDGDAYATMLLLKEICRLHEINPKKIKKEWAQFFVASGTPEEPKSEKKKPRGKKPATDEQATSQTTEKKPDGAAPVSGQAADTQKAGDAPKKRRRRRRHGRGGQRITQPPTSPSPAPTNAGKPKRKTLPPAKKGTD